MTEEEQKLYAKLCNLASSRGVPEHLVPGLCLYYMFGATPGDFLYSVLTNDLRGAMAHGDDNSIRGLKKLWEFVYNRLPGKCWGSPEKVAEWPAIAQQEGAVTVASFATCDQ